MTTTTIRADELAARHIGQRIRFTTLQGAEVADVLVGVISEQVPDPATLRATNASRGATRAQVGNFPALTDVEPTITIAVRLAQFRPNHVPAIDNSALANYFTVPPASAIQIEEGVQQ